MTGNNPERYSFREKTWQRISAEESSEKSAAAVLNGCIYAVDDSLTQVFDPSKNLWVKKTSNLCRRRSGYAFVFNGKLIIAGGTIITPQKLQGKYGITHMTNVTTNVKTVEVYCEKNDRW